jgi:HPt (histidine-containing phosphotransfer) domain-containing protein
MPPTSTSGATTPYDRSKVLDNLDGDEELLREIAGIFLAGYQHEVERMRAALAASDVLTLNRIAHTLKGSVGNFGAQAAIDAAAVIERKTRDGQMAGIDGDFANLTTVIEQLAVALRCEVGAGTGQTL